jgi:hypothetical protein
VALIYSHPGKQQWSLFNNAVCNYYMIDILKIIVFNIEVIHAIKQFAHFTCIEPGYFPSKCNGNIANNAQLCQ